MSDGELTIAMVEEAMDKLWNAPPRPRQYLATPSEKRHLDEHDGGKAGCDECLAIWLRAEVRGSL